VTTGPSQSEFSTECNIVLPFSVSSTFLLPMLSSSC
jgi:hypothetical protein